MAFHENLRTLRLARGLTQPMLAEKACIEQSYLSKLENGRSKPSDEVLSRLAQALDVKVEALLQNGDDAEERARRLRRWTAVTALAGCVVLGFFAGRITAIYPLELPRLLQGSEATVPMTQQVAELAPRNIEIIDVSNASASGKRVSIFGRASDMAAVNAYMDALREKFGGGFLNIHVSPEMPSQPRTFNLVFQAQGAPATG